jgi:outer membrane protein OmpA-like peptidoglycan-associated protein
MLVSDGVGTPRPGLEKDKTMGKIVRSSNTSVVMMVSVLIALFLACTALPAAAQAASPQTTAFNQNVKEVFFPYNIYNKVIDPAVLDSNAAWLKQNPDAKMWIQGYADPRGDIVYNLVLSYRRAQWVKTQFVKRGVDESRIGFATGWGKLYQTCAQSDDKCFQQNRRVDTVPPESMMFHWGQ